LDVEEEKRMRAGCWHRKGLALAVTLAALLTTGNPARVLGDPPSQDAAEGNKNTVPRGLFSAAGYQTSPCEESALTSQDSSAESGFLDNLSLFAGLDGSKSPQDLGINAHMGGRAAVNWGCPILEAIGLGFQVGTAVNYSDNAVAVLGEVNGTE